MLQGIREDRRVTRSRLLGGSCTRDSRITLALLGTDLQAEWRNKQEMVTTANSSSPTGWTWKEPGTLMISQG